MASAEGKEPDLPARVKAYLGAVFGAGVLSVASGVAALVAAGAPSAAAALAFAGIAAGTFLLQRRGLVLHWRGQRVATTFDEPLLFLSLLLLTPAGAVLALGLGAAGSQVVARRNGVKAAYNVAQHVVSSSAGAAAFALLAALGAHPLLGGAAAVAVYSTASYALVSLLFALLERASPLRTFVERFAPATVLNSVFGVSLVVALVALWKMHPLATLAIAPLGLLALTFTRLNVRLEREETVRRQLERVTTSIGTLTTVDAVAERIVHECGDLFLAGKVTLTLQRGVAAGPSTWSRTFEGGARAGALPMEAPIVSRTGETLGAIAVYPAQRAPTANDIQVDRPLLTVLAAGAAAALDVALAIRQLVALKNLHEGIVRHAPAGVLRLDAEARVVQANDHFRRRIGEPAVVWPALAAHPDLGPALQRLLTGETFEHEALRLDGRAYDVAGVPLSRDEAGGASEGAVLLFHDVTTRIEAEEAQRRASITRPLVRRIVLDLVHNTGASEGVIGAVGRRLAAEVAGREVEDFAYAFRQMGLGDLDFEGVAGDTYTFTADDLLERREKAREPTCHLARGFLEGVVASLHQAEALGTEIRCQSQGHPRCTFMVKPRAREVPPPRRRILREA